MDAYIVDAVRTPRGKASPKGSLRSVKPVKLLDPLYKALQERNQLDTQEVEDILLGCVTQTGEQGADIAKISALYAGWSEHISGTTLNRFCASGLDAIHLAASKVHSGMEDLLVSGGVESVSRVPMFSDKGAWFADPEVNKATRFVHMGISGDLIANLEGFSRQELDEYAIRSQQRAAKATEAGYFSPSLIPIRDSEGNALLTKDELIRGSSTTEQLAEFPPTFEKIDPQGAQYRALKRYPELKAFEFLHHKGNSPALADGAALLLLANKAKAQELQLPIRARILSFANCSVEPILMLTGGQLAVQKALKKAGLSPQDIDLFEFNEAFAATVLKFQRDLNIDPEKLNPNGGTIAMGHALGATGGMLMATLLDELERRELRYGVVAISGGAGVGAATVIERIS